MQRSVCGLSNVRVLSSYCSLNSIATASASSASSTASILHLHSNNKSVRFCSNGGSAAVATWGSSSSNSSGRVNLSGWRNRSFVASTTFIPTTTIHTPNHHNNARRMSSTAATPNNHKGNRNMCIGDNNSNSSGWMKHSYQSYHSLTSSSPSLPSFKFDANIVRLTATSTSTAASGAAASTANNAGIDQTVVTSNPIVPSTTTTTTTVAASDSVAATNKRTMSPYQNWMSLTKARLSASSAFTGLITYATTDIATIPGAGVLFSGMLCHAMCANIVNELKERDFDAQMSRTKNRPLVTGAISVPTAQFAAAGLLAAGSGILYAGGGWVPTVLSLATVGLYTHVYTPLKRKTVLNTEVGALVGAGPPLIGWGFANAPWILPEPWLMAAYLFGWQMSHFMVIAIKYRDDYAKGGYKMRSLDDPSGRRCFNYGAFWFFVTWAILWMTYSLDVTSIMAPIAGSAGFIYTLRAASKYRSTPSVLRARIAYLNVLMPLLWAIQLLPLGMCWLFHQHPHIQWVKSMRETGDSLCVWHGPTRVMETVFDRSTRAIRGFFTTTSAEPLTQNDSTSVAAVATTTPAATTTDTIASAATSSPNNTK